MFEADVSRADFLNDGAVEGELLAHRLARGALPAGEALRYAVEIGALLQRAHARGGVHGALSPHSIAITPDGLRLLRPPALSEPCDAPYRSPEQVRGEAPDERSDIFAFGAVLYEAVWGRRAFSGEGAELDRAILEDFPAPVTDKTALPAALERIVAGCLQKDPLRRRQRIQNVLLELKLAAVRPAPRRAAAPAVPQAPACPAPPLSSPRPPGPGAVRAVSPAPPAQTREPANGVSSHATTSHRIPGGSGRVARTAWHVGVGLGLLAVTATVVAATLYLHRAPAGVRFTGQIASPGSISYPGAPSVSPDGRLLTFSAIGPQGARMLWLRPLDGSAAEPIHGTEGGLAPFWSPDSQFIAFFANGSLSKVRASGGPVDTICKTESNAGGGSWNRNGVILFAPGVAGGLYRVPAAGGQPQSVTRLSVADSERAHLWPQFLPDGVHFLFFVLTEWEGSTGVYTGALDSPGRRRILGSEANAVYCPAGRNDNAGWLLFLRERTLAVQPFNAARLALEGQPAELARGVGAVRSQSLAPMSVSDNAVLVYQSLSDPTRQLVWLDRAGKQLATADLSGEWAGLRIAPDGKRAAAARIAPGESKADLWLVDADGKTSQLTNTPTHEGSPVWSPDGSRMVFFEDQNLRLGQTGTFELFVKAAVESGKMEPFYTSILSKYPTDWSRDGRYVVFGAMGEGTLADIWVYSIPERRATPLLNTVYGEGYGVISPDGRWLAYQSDESGANEVYVQIFKPGSNDTQRRWQASTGAGALPRWRADGGELFYMSPSGALMAVTVHAAGEEFRFEPPHALFQTRPVPKIPWNLYDVSPDGQRFLVNLPLEWSSSAPINVTVNWSDKLKN
ncbi:MAG: hypothetical protein LAQ30_27060 [Acidobacteriia bacterium]|nr:hypothetical protein [Terriglobia bacterium]